MATDALLGRPTDVAVDAIGNLYIEDRSNHRIRKVELSGIIFTIAGNGDAAFAGDGGLAAEASLYGPAGVEGTGTISPHFGWRHVSDGTAVRWA